MHTRRDILTKAFVMIQNPDSFTRHKLAGDANDVPVSPTSPEAVCWCSIGAAIKAASDLGETGDELDRTIDFLHEQVENRGIIGDRNRQISNMADFNDTASYDAVVKLWQDILNSDLDNNLE